MGKPDQTEKMLLDYNDEFAEIFSAFVFKNKVTIDPAELREAATEYHHLERENPRELRRDVVKLYSGLELGIIVLGLENQTNIDPTMPIRMMGYNWARYRYEVKQVCRRRWPCPKLPPSKELLAPVFSHVLNFSIKHKWEWPLALSDIVNVPPGLEEFFQDYKITVTNVAWLTPEERSQLTGDFRILVDALCELRETGKLTGSTRVIRHLEELLAALGAVTGRKMFVKKLRQHNEQKEIKTMDDVLEIWEQKIFANGKKEGYESGKKRGFAKGKEQGQNSTAVRMCQRFGKTKSETVSCLMQDFGMTEAQALSATNEYWQK